jgi:ADP-ribose pyrophosphatase
MTIKPWEVLSSRRDHSFRIFDLRTDRTVSPRNGEEHEFYILESKDWVNVIPITSNNDIILIRQYRHGIGKVTLEIPGGIVEAGDTPEETARKELREETGYCDSSLTFLGMVYPNPAFLNNQCHTFLAREVYKVGDQDQDSTEDIEVVIRPLEEVPHLIKKGEISHSLILAAFYRFFMEYQK